MPDKIANISEINYDVIKQLSITASKIALENFEWRFVTFVFFNSTLLEGVEIFLHKYRKTIIIGKGTFYPNFVQGTRQYVLFHDNVIEMISTLHWMRNHNFDNTGKFIVVCQTTECDENEAMKAFWDHKISNVIFLKNVEQQVLCYTYYPLNDSRCETSKPTQLDLRSCIGNADHKFCRNIFGSKLNNMNTCTLIASTFIQIPFMRIENGISYGTDGDLLQLLAYGLNASLKIVTPRVGNGWGKLEKNGTWSGSLADLYDDYANLSMTSAAVTLARFSHFQMSKPYSFASVVWVTHPPKMLPSSLKLTYPFQPNAQIALAVSFLMIVVCAYFVRSRIWHWFCRAIEVSRPRVSVLFYSWMIFMGLPTSKLPTKTAMLYIVLLWIWFGIFMRTFYQVSLVTVLKTTYYFGDFDSIEDAIDAKYPFGGGAALKDYYIDNPQVYNPWMEIDAADLIPTMRNVSQGMEFVLAMKMETVNILSWEEKIHVHILSRKIVKSPAVIFFKKFSPLAKSVNRVLTHLIETGFSAKYYQYYTSKKFKHKKSDTSIPMNTHHFTGCYFILISGWAVSFISFVFELLYYKLCKYGYRK